MAHRRKIVVYSQKSFYDDVPDEAVEKSNIFWHNYFLRLENYLKIKLIDKNLTELVMFRCHIAKTNDPLAKKVIRNKLKYKYIDDLGRIRLHIDNSKGLFEFEAVNNELCQDDINHIRDFQGDVVSKPHYLPSKVKSKLDGFEKWQQEILLNQVESSKLQKNQSLQHEEVLLMIKALTLKIKDLENN